MRKLKNKTLKRGGIILMCILITLGLTGTYLKLTGRDQQLLLVGFSYLLKPAESFDLNKMAEPPNYELASSWASLPTRNDEADIVPVGVSDSINDGHAPVDVFLVLGTGYLGNASWTWPMTKDSATVENTRFILANEASIFNSCCNIYVSNYRQASIYAYYGTSQQNRNRILDAAYSDVSNAFYYFLEHHNNGKPIVIVSHSQGTHHAVRLLKEIDGLPEVASKLVVAYTIGSGGLSLTQNFVDSLQHFTTCQSATDTQCLVHWDSFGKNGKEKFFVSPEQSICVNPLSWITGTSVAQANLNLGSMPVLGFYSFRLDDKPTGNLHFNERVKPMLAYTGAQCRDGFLYVDDQTETEYSKLGEIPSHNLHGINFPLFHMNIRKNVQTRINEYFVRKSQ